MTHAPARRPVASSVGLLLAGHLVTILVGLATVVVVSRVLDEAALGRWRLAQALLTYLIVIADMGLSMLAVREIARRPEEAARYAGPVLLVRLGVGIMLAAVAITAVLLAGPPGEVAAFYVVTFLAVIPTSLSLIHVLQGRERMGTYAVARLAITAVAGLLGLASLLVTGELIALVIWPLAVGLVVDVWLAWITIQHLGVRLVAGTPHMWGLLTRAGAPFLIGAVAIQLVSNADAVIIGAFRGEAQLGIYAAAYLVAGQLLFLAGPVASAVYPRLAHLHQVGEGLPVALARTTGLLGLVVLPFCIGSAIVSGELVRILYGERYVEAGVLLAVLLGMPAIGFYNVAVAQALNAAREQRAVMRVSVIAASVNVAVNVLLIPVVGLVGAAVAAVATEAVTAVAYTASAARIAGYGALASYAAPLRAALPMGAVAIGSQRLGLPLAFTVVAGAATYAGVIALNPPPAVTELRRILLRSGGRHGD